MTTQGVGNRRLLKLAAFLETLPKHKFDLDIIVDDNRVFGEDGNEFNLPSADCGTAACAIGWCPNVFPRNCEYQNRGYISVVDKKTQYTDFTFAQNFFSLNRDESYYLFDPAFYNERRQGNKSVAKRIRNFVAKRPDHEEILKAKLTNGHW